MTSTEKQEPNNPQANATDTSSQEASASTGTSEPASLSSLRIPFAIVIALTLLSGIVHGIIDGRWTTSEDLIAQGSKLLQAPEQFGDWKLIETRELADNASKMLRPYGSLVRVYRNEKQDADIIVAILFGQRGPIAVHTPEICYDSVGTEQVGKREVETVRHGGSKDTFWSVKFSEGQSPEPNLDVWYGWSDGDGWIASEHPRFWMVDNLYKIQIAGPVGRESYHPCKEFLTDFLPKTIPLLQ